MGQEIKSVGWWHQQLATWMIGNPDRTLTEAARYFNVSLPWLSTLKNSDCFEAYYRARVNEQFEMTALGINAKTKAMTELALDAMLDKLHTTSSTMSTEQLLEVTKTGLKALGYGANARSHAPQQLQVNVGIVNKIDLEKARERMHAASGVLTQEAEVIRIPHVAEAV